MVSLLRTGFTFSLENGQSSRRHIMGRPLGVDPTQIVGGNFEQIHPFQVGL